MTTLSAAARPRPWRLGNRTRKTTLVLHILAAGSWFGLDVAMAVLIFTALSSDEVGTKVFAYRALELVAVWPMLTAALVCLGSGVLLGLGTTYGLFRYWWVVIKLAINLVLTTLVFFALRPNVLALAEQAREAGARPESM